MKESLILCDYAWPIAHARSSEGYLGAPSVESKIYSAVVGNDMDEEGLYETGERIFNLQRAILVREGHKGKKQIYFRSLIIQYLSSSQFIIPNALFRGKMESQ